MKPSLLTVLMASARGEVTLRPPLSESAPEVAPSVSTGFTVPGEMHSGFYFSRRFQAYGDVFEPAHDENRQATTCTIERRWNARMTNWSSTPRPGGIGLSPSKAPVMITEAGSRGPYYGPERDFSGGNHPANREVLWTSGFDTSSATFKHLQRPTKVRHDTVARAAP